MSKPWQIKKIKTLQGKLKLEDEAYRGILSGYGANSCKDLDYKQSMDMIQTLEGMARKAGVHISVAPKGHGWGKQRFEDLKDRGPDYPSPGQLRFLEGLWDQVTKQNSVKAKRKAFNELLNNKFGITRIEWIKKNQVEKVIRLLEGMGAEAQ